MGPTFYYYLQKGLWNMVHVEWENDTHCSPHPKVPFLLNLTYYLFIHSFIALFKRLAP